MFGPKSAVLDALPVVRTVIEKFAGLPGVAVSAEDEGLQLANAGAPAQVTFALIESPAAPPAIANCRL